MSDFSQLYKTHTADYSYSLMTYDDMNHLWQLMSSFLHPAIPIPWTFFSSLSFLETLSAFMTLDECAQKWPEMHDDLFKKFP